ncbi:MAG TPA: bifunctional phosphopantothenoylcysteine decarboxylase/phosphopantothenate--cysteine ligase CoaBC [Dehalococcoidia bacterium]|nr:bifunctional phosphopantothenoylcysteine decarboxylase/phosphopantothenate--cysteine ligase CoaBC [Dehalococcoidia bacterium]
MLKRTRIVLGVSGSIASYKAADLASKLTQAGALVDVILTESAQKFVAPLTFRALTLRPVYTDMFDPATPAAEAHVELARAAAAVLIAPASATTIARLAHGLADNMLALTALATTAPVVVAPAMDAQMWDHAATRANVATLLGRGVRFVGPAEGRLASGHTGLGRLAEPDAILGALRQALGAHGDLAARRIVVSAGGTHEPIDPVRYVGNRSSGKMGFAIAEAARDRGALVTLVAGPVALATPYGVARVDVRTTAEMAAALRRACDGCDALVMAAAPADFHPAAPASQKIKRTGASVSIELVPNEDIIAGLAGTFVKVGFAAETEQVLVNAHAKIAKKGLDLIAANDVTAPQAGFAADTNLVTLISADGTVEELPLLSKYDVGHRILDRVAALLAARTP